VRGPRVPPCAPAPRHRARHSDARLRAIAAGEAELLDHEQQQLAAQLEEESLVLTSDAAELRAADAVIIAVPTPVDERRQPDLRPLRGACDTVVLHARAGQTIILTSTTSIASTRALLVEPLERRGLVVGEDVFVAFAPECIDPGVKAHAQQATPRVVGGVTEDCFKRAARVLRHTCSEIHAVSSAEAAEMAKLMENTFRAANIALSFEFAEPARRYGAALPLRGRRRARRPGAAGALPRDAHADRALPGAFASAPARGLGRGRPRDAVVAGEPPR
jgi:UDP-N-acetyl-D-glucosamine dehydrogenase